MNLVDWRAPLENPSRGKAAPPGITEMGKIWGRGVVLGVPANSHDKVDSGEGKRGGRRLGMFRAVPSTNRFFKDFGQKLDPK